MLADQGFRLGGDKGGTVVHLDDQGPAAEPEQGPQGDADDLGGLGVTRQRQELPAAGEVTDQEKIAVLAVDGCGWLGEVHGPDAAGPGPAQGVDEPTAPAAVDAAAALEQV